MLTVKQLRYSWPSGVGFAFDFTLDAGRILAVQGPSGSGKTTLLELLAGFLPPHSGALCWQGRDLLSLAPWERPITTVFQANNLFDHLDCRSNVLIGLGPPGLHRPAPELLARIDAGFDALGIGGLQRRFPGEISGGQQQRVTLVRALLRARPILLLDESFNALDWATRADCFDALVALVQRQRMATLIVSHDERDARYLECDVLPVEPDPPADTHRAARTR